MVSTTPHYLKAGFLSSFQPGEGKQNAPSQDRGRGGTSNCPGLVHRSAGSHIPQQCNFTSIYYINTNIIWKLCHMFLGEINLCGRLWLRPFGYSKLRRRGSSLWWISLWEQVSVAVLWPSKIMAVCPSHDLKVHSRWHAASCLRKPFLGLSTWGDMHPKLPHLLTKQVPSTLLST